MQRAALWAIGVAALALAGPAAIARADAGEAAAGCTLATLDGEYLFSTVTTNFPPAFGAKKPFLGSAAGAHVFNGDGTGSDFVTFSINGIVQNVPSPIATKYTLKADCTGTYETPSAGLHFAILVAVDGSQLSLIETDPGSTSAQGPLFRVKLGAPK